MGKLNAGEENVVGEGGGVYVHNTSWERIRVLVTNGQTQKYLYPHIL